jgi:hypothetical protein
MHAFIRVYIQECACEHADACARSKHEVKYRHASVCVYILGLPLKRMDLLVTCCNEKRAIFSRGKSNGRYGNTRSVHCEYVGWWYGVMSAHIHALHVRSMYVYALRSCVLAKVKRLCVLFLPDRHSRRSSCDNSFPILCLYMHVDLLHTSMVVVAQGPLHQTYR